MKNALNGKNPNHTPHIQEFCDYADAVSLGRAEEVKEQLPSMVQQVLDSNKVKVEGQAKRLVEVLCEFVSDSQAEKIRHDVFLTDRIKTNNKGVLNNVAIINEAMSRKMDGKEHVPEKISFKYLKHTITNVNQQVERRKGDRYVVSPYKLLINGEEQSAAGHIEPALVNAKRLNEVGIS